MDHHPIEKEFRDFAEDIEGVNIHYLCVASGAAPDWDNARVTRYMPLVEPGVRRLSLKLPAHIMDPVSRKPVIRYTLLHYFEVFRGGDRQYSPVYSEIVDTGTTPTAIQVATETTRPR